MRNPKAISIKRLLLLTLFAATGLASANDSTMVTSPHTGQNIFQVVFEGRNSNTEARKGIYSISSNGKEQPAVLGEVLGVSRGFNGVLAQSQAAASSTADSLAVVDGKLVLFNRNTRTGNNKTKALRLGDGAFSVFDPYLGQDSMMQFAIGDLDDILVRSVHQLPRSGSQLPYGGELFVATIRSANLYGDGLTLAFVVENPSDQKSQPKIMRNRAYVLNYNFLSEAQINKLKIENGQGFSLYSSTLLSSTISNWEDVLNAPNNSDTKTQASLNKWLAHLKASQRFFEGTSESRMGTAMIEHLRSGVPFLDFLSMQPTYLSIPIFDLGNDSFGIRQAFDPRSGDWTVIRAERTSMNPRPDEQKGNLYFMEQGQFDQLQPIAEGQVSVDTGGKYSLRAIESDLDNPQYALAVGDQTLFLLATSSGLKPVKVDSLNITNLRNFEAFHVQKKEGDSNQHTILVSATERTGKKRTYAVYLSELENGDLVPRTTREISQSFMKAAELKMRAALKWDSSKRDLVLYFDSQTPVKGPAAYKKLLERKESDGSVVTEKFRETQYSKFRLADDRTTGANGGQKVYMRSAAVEAVMGVVFQHRLYGANRLADADKQMTGLYYEPEDATLEREGADRSAYPKNDQPIVIASQINGFIAAGKPVWTKGRKGFEPILASARPQEVGTSVELNLLPYQALGATPDQGKFYLNLSLRTINEQTPIHFQNIEIPARFDGLVGAQILQGKRNHSSEFHVLLLFGKAGSPQTGLYLVSGKYKKETKNQYTKYITELSHNGKWLDRGDVTPSDLKDRIRPDVQGRLYWFDNPDENVDSVRFRVRELSEPDNLRYPNKAGADSAINIRFDEAEEEKDGKSTMAGDWGISSAITLQNLFPAFKKYTDAAEKRAKETKKKGSINPHALDGFADSGSSDAWKKKHRPSSVPFVEFLNSLAQPLADRAEGEPKRRIILVEDDMRDQFVIDFAAHAAEFGNEHGFDISWSNRNNFGLYSIDPNSTVEESVEEYQHMRGAAKRKPIVLATTLAKLNQTQEFVSEAKDSDGNPVQMKASRWLMMATDGKRVDLTKQRNRLPLQDVEVPTIIIGTPKELEQAKALAGVENDLGVFDQFEIDNRFLTSSWMHWPPGSKKARSSMADHQKAIVSEEEYKVFPDLEALFSQAAKGELRGEQIALVVPKELKPLIHKLVMSRWATKDRSLAGPWHYSNRELVFYQLAGSRNENSQAEVFENFQAMRGAAGFRNVVNYSDLERILNIGRPVNESGRQFRVIDPALKNRAEAVLSLDATSDQLRLIGEGEVPIGGGLSANEIDDLRDELSRETDRYDEAIADIESLKGKSGDEYQETREYQELLQTRDEAKAERDRISAVLGEVIEVAEEDGAASDRKLPHLLWLFASEGTRVQPQTRRDWNLADAAKRKTATIVIGTPEEWAQAEADTDFESAYLDLEQNFEFVELNAPSEELKVQLIESLFRRPEIEALDYSFYLDSDEEMSEDEARKQLIYHFVNRVEQIAGNLELESTSSFIRAFTELRANLSEDIYLRRHRRIDRRYLERLFFKTFPITINLDNLEDDDPLKRIVNVQQAARELTKLGYQGPMELKELTLSTMLSQTTGSDAGRPIPNSQIYYGGTSSGKTYLFKMKMELLGLTKYDPNRAGNEEAGFIIINVQNLVEDNGGADKLTVDEAIAQIEDLLAQPNGHRAQILFDDAHKTGTKNIHQKLHSYIQSFFEAPDGVKRVKKKDGTYKDVPVQNLGLYMTVNPTMDKKQKERYEEGNDIKKKVLAALASHDVPMEESYLARWSEIIDLDKFPRGAKVPALVQRIRDRSSESPQTVVVDPSVIGRLVGMNEKSNAREFLNPAANALVSIPPSAEPASLYIVSDRMAARVTSDDVDPQLGEQQAPATQSPFRTSLNLTQTVREISQVDAISWHNPESVLRLVDFTMNNLRSQLYNHAVLATQNTEILRLPLSGQASTLQRNFILAMVTHMVRHPKIPLAEFKVSGADFRTMTSIEIEELMASQNRRKRDQKESYFPIAFGIRSNFSMSDPGRFINDTVSESRMSRTMHDVFSETMDELAVVIRDMMLLYMRYDSQAIDFAQEWRPHDVEAWYDSLDTEDKTERFKQLSNRLLELFSGFTDKLVDSNLLEVRRNEQTFDYYSQGRLFSYLIDATLVRMQWGSMSKMVLDVLDRSSDLQLGQKPSFRNWAFKSAYSPLSIVDSEFLSDTVKNPKDLTPVAIENRQKAFELRCHEILNGGQ
jgi:hypothetical protein